VVVAGTADVAVGGELGLRGALGLDEIELVLEDVLHASARARSMRDGSRAGSLEALRRELLGQPEEA